MLEAVGEIKPPADADDGPEFDGYCARSCGAYQYLVTHDPRAATLAGDRQVRLMRVKPDRGESHYWLVNSKNEVVDLNFGAYDKPDKRFPYAAGKGASVRRDVKDKTKPASKDSQRIIAIVQASLDVFDAGA